MQFPSPQHFLPEDSYGRAASPEIQQHHADPYQWEKFDDLFDRVFATQGAKSPPASPPRSKSYPQTGSVSVPGEYVKGRLMRSMSSGGESSSDESGEGSSFADAWDDALRRTKRTVTTTTKRRIIRHTPTPTPRLEIPEPTLAPRLKYPRTPYPQHDESPEGSEVDSEDLQPLHGAMTPPTIVQADEHGATLRVPESGLTPELHSPVRYQPPSSPRLDRRHSRLGRVEIMQSPWETAKFDMPTGLSRNDIHIGFSDLPGQEKVTVSWQHTDVEEFVEEGKLVRERKERRYQRTLPLPRGTKWEQITANMWDGGLTITYPKPPHVSFSRARGADVLQLTR